MLNNNPDRILYLIKTRGPQTAQSLAELLRLTSMGARQHLQKLEQEGWLESIDRAEKRGRPSRYWHLTEQAQARFPDRHNDLTLQLLDSVRAVFGEQGLTQLIDQRQQQTLQQYQQQLAAYQDVATRLKYLAKLRDLEGYMTTVEQDRRGWWLLENHCPICAAASRCQQFCSNELAMFQTLFPEVQVSREKHLLAGAERCAYLFQSR